MLVYRTASSGYWTGWLLPCAFILSQSSRGTSILLSIVAVNTLLLSFFYYTKANVILYIERVKLLNVMLSLITFVYGMYVGVGPYEIFIFVSLNFALPYVFYNIIRYYPRSFTFGEGLIVTQAFIFTFWNCVKTLPTPPQDLTQSPDGEVVILIVEAGFIVMILVTRFIVITMKPWTFLFTEEFFCIWGKCCLVGMVYRMSTNDLWYLFDWAIKFFWDRILLLSYWIICSAVAIVVVYWKGRSRSQSSSTDRKYFHFLILAVYLPGILIERNLLYLASAAILYVFVIVELVRFLKLKLFGAPLGEKIDQSIGVFRDHQDEGRLIVTPIYLLAGCSVPVWLIGLTKVNSVDGFELAAAFSGILSVGIGDTFASVGGSTFGKLKWKATNKSVEGTLCCILSQIVFVILLQASGLVLLSIPVLLTLAAAIIINSLVESLTDQIDNLILPLVTFNIILGSRFILQLLVSP